MSNMFPWNGPKWKWQFLATALNTANLAIYTATVVLVIDALR
jgi:hypothetical protein